jgi:endonuclease YncB( thermonuclease family)
MRRTAALLLAGALLPVPLAVATAGGAAAADPTSGPCLENGTGPTCSYWYGTLAGVNDGDGVDVDLEGDGTSTPVSIRLNGIQAMELTRYSDVGDREGQCHAVEAADRLEEVVGIGTRVRLAAQHTSSASGSRPRRTLFYRDANGVWRDVARTMLYEGRVLWLPATDEPAHNAEYGYWAQRSASRKVRLWDTDYCGSGPSQANPIKLWVTWDANGNDGTNLNGEWVRIKNRGSSSISLAGWSVRDSAYRGMTASDTTSTLGRGYVFPSGASIPAGGAITVFIGSGTSTSTRFYWNQTASVFENVTASTNLGDGAYLFDPDGDLRASMMYPCRTGCSDPLQGKLTLSAMYDPRGTDTADNEYVYLRNNHTARIHLESYQIWNWPNGYTFGAGSYLDPGEAMRLYLGKGTSTRTKRYWGLSSPYLTNSGDNVALRTLTNVVVACKTWGDNTRCRVTD